MKKWFEIFDVILVLFLMVFIPEVVTGNQEALYSTLSKPLNRPKVNDVSMVKKQEIAMHIKRIQIPFIENNNQMDEQVKFYAHTFGGTVFVTKGGEIVYALPNNSSDLGVQSLESDVRSQRSEDRRQEAEDRIQECRGELHSPNVIHNAGYRIQDDRESCYVDRDSKSEFQNPKLTSSDSKNLKSPNPKSAIQNLKSGVALKEEFVGARINAIQGEDASVTKVNYFKGYDPSKWKTNVSTYDAVSLGDVYDGIELKLKAYGNNVEKLFCVKPKSNPDQIKVQISGAKSITVDEEGQLVAETELGPVKFTKPIAYQEIDGKRVYVDVEYDIQKTKARMRNQEDKRSEARSKRTEARGKIHASRKTGHGSRKTATEQNLKLAKRKFLNPKSKIVNLKSEYGFTVASYDKSHDLIIDPLLASTYLGASNDGNDSGSFLALNTSGNVYVTGQTSSDFPTSRAYDTFLMVLLMSLSRNWTVD